MKKVEICGINTTALPKLSSSDTEKLILELKSGNENARNKLIVGNMRLVLSVLHRYLPRVCNMDDAFQVGCIGLIKAVDNFDINMDVKFSTYAVPMIIGEIRRYIRDNNTIRVSRSVKDTAYKALQTKEFLYNKFNREPSIDELSKESKIIFITDEEMILCKIDE